MRNLALSLFLFSYAPQSGPLPYCKNQWLHRITCLPSPFRSFKIKNLSEISRKYLKGIAVIDIQMRTTLEFHFVPVRVAVKEQTINGNKSVEENQQLYSVDGNTNKWSYCFHWYRDASIRWIYSYNRIPRLAEDIGIW